MASQYCKVGSSFLWHMGLRVGRGTLVGWAAGAVKRGMGVARHRWRATALRFGRALDVAVDESSAIQREL